MANTSRDELGGPTHADTLYLGGTSETVVLTGSAVKLTVGSITAAGSTQSDATALTYPVNDVTAANGTKGVKLPTAAAGLNVIIYNNATSLLKVWANTSDDIVDATADGYIPVQPKTMVVLTALDDTTWSGCWSTDFCQTDFVVPNEIDFAINTSNGTKIGTGATQKVGFWNATPVVQQTVGAAVTATTKGANTGTSAAGLTLIGATHTGDVSADIMNDFDAIREDCAALATLLNRIRTDLFSLGLAAAP